MGAGYRFTLANSGRDMWDAELRIGTTDASHDLNPTHNTGKGVTASASGYLDNNRNNRYHNNYWTVWHPGTTTTSGYTSYHWSDPHTVCVGVDGILTDNIPLFSNLQDGASIRGKLIPGTDDIEDYENAVQGFQTRYFTVNKAMLKAAKISGFTFTYFERGNTTKQNMYVSFDAMARKYGYNEDGNLVIPYTEWGKGYLTNAVVAIDHYQAGTTADAFVDLYGYVNDVNDLELYGRVIDRVHSSEWRYSTTANPANLLPNGWTSNSRDS